MKIILFSFFLFIPAVMWSQEKSYIATPAEEKIFNELCHANWETVFSDDCTRDWSKKWSLDGKVGFVENSSDGMPDSWETENGFDINNPADRNGDSDYDGFTNLEEYLISIVSDKG